jgi:hypothetical protein
MVGVNHLLAPIGRWRLVLPVMMRVVHSR